MTSRGDPSNSLARFRACGVGNAAIKPEYRWPCGVFSLPFPVVRHPGLDRSCASRAWAGGIAFVINSGSASISVIDMATQKEVRRIPTLREPHHLVLSPDGGSLLVGDTAGNQMMFLDPNTGEVQKRMPVADPYQLGFSPDGKFLVVNGLLRNQVDVYDAAGMKLLKRFPVVATPSHLAYSPDSSTVFVSLQDSDKLAAFDLRTMTEKWTVPVGKTPAGVLWLNGKVLVADMGTDYIAVVDPDNRQGAGACRRPARAPTTCSCRPTARSCGSTTAPAARRCRWMPRR